MGMFIDPIIAIIDENLIALDYVFINLKLRIKII